MWAERGAVINVTQSDLRGVSDHRFLTVQGTGGRGRAGDGAITPRPVTSLLKGLPVPEASPVHHICASRLTSPLK